jgi:hypothetical protein
MRSGYEAGSKVDGCLGRREGFETGLRFGESTAESCGGRMECSALSVGPANIGP